MSLMMSMRGYLGYSRPISGEDQYRVKTSMVKPGFHDRDVLMIPYCIAWRTDRIGQSRVVRRIP